VPAGKRPPRLVSRNRLERRTPRSARRLVHPQRSDVLRLRVRAAVWGRSRVPPRRRRRTCRPQAVVAVLPAQHGDLQAADRALPDGSGRKGRLPAVGQPMIALRGRAAHVALTRPLSRRVWVLASEGDVAVNRDATAVLVNGTSSVPDGHGLYVVPPG